jgi:hypothetical protein
MVRSKSGNIDSIQIRKIKMKLKERNFRFLVLVLLVLFAGSTALAYWDPGDDYKMHFPQLPDPEGWDVYAEYDHWSWCPWGTKRGLADDWVCTESGGVLDIHFWGSWKGDIVGQTNNVYIAIFANDTTGDFNKPGELLWQRVFTNQEYESRSYGTGDQGWFDPYTGYHISHDHDNIYQYNITDIADPFYQEEGNIYWLGISMNFEGCEWGWKTADVGQYPEPYTGEHFSGGGVYLVNFDDPPEEWEWRKLCDPTTRCACEPLDLAFVITPEPATICLLGFGGLSLILRRRK